MLRCGTVADNKESIVPRLVLGVELRALPLAPIDGFVLSRIDGNSDIGSIADETGLSTEDVVKILQKLLQHKVVTVDGDLGGGAGPIDVLAPPGPSQLYDLSLLDEDVELDR